MHCHCMQQVSRWRFLEQRWIVWCGYRPVRVLLEQGRRSTWSNPLNTPPELQWICQGRVSPVSVCLERPSCYIAWRAPRPPQE